MGSLSEFLRKRRENKYTYDANGMKVKNKKQPKTVKDIKISKKFLPLRITLFVVFLAGGITAICFAVGGMSSVAKGWKEITSTGGKSNASNFTFLYYLSSDNGQDNGAIYKNLNNLYTQLTEKTYFVFSSTESTTATNNIYYLNHHFNENVEVDPLLYKTLKKMEDADNKVVYFAPVYDQYQNLYNADNDTVAKQYDPYYSSQAETYYKEIADFINNKDIYFSFPSENVVRLNVSDSYQTYVTDHNIDKVVDMWYFENAASIDYFVEVLEEYNFRNYRINSYDGYVRTSIDSTLLSELSVSYSCYTEQHNYILPEATIKITKPTSLVEFKSFPVSSNEDFYIYQDIKFVHHFLDPLTGKYKSCRDSLYLYSDATKPVVDILLKGSDIFIQDVFDTSALKASGYKYLYCDSNIVKYNDANLTFSSLLEVNFCKECGYAFSSGTTCPKCSSTDIEHVKFEKELIND